MALQDGGRFARTAMLLGEEAMGRLRAATVAIFGIGGVGSFVAEGLARAGVGHFVLVDSDRVEISNLNRQIHATTATLGQPKVLAMRERILAINPAAEALCLEGFYLPERADSFFVRPYSYVVDAIDTVTGKISLAVECHRRQLPLISSMGAGNKLDPTRFEVADIYQTSVDPLARVLRRKLKEYRIPGLKVVYSREKPRPVAGEGGAAAGARPRAVPGSVSFVPSVAGLIIAGEVVRDLGGEGRLPG